MGKIYVTSDLHLGHKNIIEYCNRPYTSVEDMNTQLINNWNSIISDDDTVFFLGDFCMGNKDNIISYGKQLKGHKILVLGNHDHGSKAAYKEAGFEQIYGEQVVIHFDEYDKTIHFSHHRKPNDETHYLNLYGHQHDKPDDDDMHKCVCVELWNYKPILLDDLIK